jgi:hypothetical protein
LIKLLALKMEKPKLKTTSTDIAAAVARGVVSACPVIGGLISEAVNQIILHQKLDRIQSDSGQLIRTYSGGDSV